MNTKIILGLATGLFLSLSAIGCGGNGTGSTSTPDMAHGNTNPDMTFVCVKSPTTDTDYLNSCPPTGVDSILIMPFFPTLAPNGVLPKLQ